MAQRYDELLQFVKGLEADFVKFYDKGQKAAGTRVRKGMLDLKKVAQDVRVEVQEMKNKEEEAAKAPAKKAAPAKKKK